MFPTTPTYLQVRRPSPTTVDFTVSTAPPPSLSQTILFVSTLLLRLLLGVSALLLLFTTLQISAYAISLPPTNSPRPPLLSTTTIFVLLRDIQNSAIGNLASNLSSQISPAVLVPAALIALYTTILRTYTEESLLVLRGLGIQTSTSSSTYLSRGTTRFIPTEKIQDVLVNEAFRGFEVRYYLVVVVQGEEEVVVVFPKLLPRRKIVETVWRGVRGCLWEGREKEKVGG